MSLILDALKRAERERHASPSPALDDLPAGRGPRRRWGRWLALALLALVVVAVAVSVARRPKRPQSVAASAEATGPQQTARVTPPPAAQQQPIPAPASRTPPQRERPTVVASPAPEVIPGTEGVVSLEELTPESDLELVPAAPAPAPTELPAAVQASPQPAPAMAEESEPEAQRPATAPSQALPAEEAARPAIPPALTQKAPVRKLREMPPDYRADFPALTVEVHVFEPQRRFVMVNGRRYREGERLAEGPQIVEIVRDGIVFDFRGERVLFTLGR